MVIERVEFSVQPGQEEAFLAHTAGFRDRFETTAGCGAFRYGRGVENPSTILYVVEWESVAAHHAARHEPWFAAFAAPLAGFVTERPTAEHFEMAER